ncbi:MAG: CvpA family protein [Nitrospirota bacterium]
MNSLDITILLIMAISLTVSTFRGGVRELFSLGSVIIGFLLASRLYQTTSDTVLRLTSYPHINNAISFIVIFMFTTVVISFIGGRISDSVKKSGFRVMDVLLGSAVGALKGVLISALIVYALLVFLPADSSVFTKSKAFPYVSQAVSVISPIGTRDFKDELDKKLALLGKKKEPPKPAGEEAKPKAKGRKK